MIKLEDYLGNYREHPDATAEKREVASAMLVRVNALLAEAKSRAAYNDEINPATGTQVSGSGNGGARPSNSVIGAVNSNHKKFRAVDVYDPRNKLDDWLDKFDSDGGKYNPVLERHGLYREHGAATDGWCHLSDLAPGSKRRTFRP